MTGIFEEQGQPWRTESAIDEERQQRLLSYYQGVVDIERGAQLSWVTLNEAVLVEAHLEGADLGKASLKQAILAGTHLEGVDLTKAHLEGATLLEAYLEGAMLQGAYLEEANLFVAHLEGARLAGAHLERTSLLDTHFEGKALGGDELKHLHAWMPHFPEVLPTADLRGVYLNNRTHLDGIHVGDDQYGYIALADVHWGDVNLTVVDWADLKRLGDETIARPLNVEEEGAQPGERGLPARAERAVEMFPLALMPHVVVRSYLSRLSAICRRTTTFCRQWSLRVRLAWHPS